MASYIKEELKDGHMITSSYAGRMPNGSLDYLNDNFDFVSFNSYGRSRNTFLNSAISMQEGNFDIYNKPVMLTETGIGAKGGGPRMDDCYPELFHNYVWGRAFNGMASNGLYWEFKPQVTSNPNSYSQVAPLTAFMAGIDFEDMKFTPQTYPRKNEIEKVSDYGQPIIEIESMVLKSENGNYAIGWVHNRSNYLINWISQSTCPVSSITNDDQLGTVSYRTYKTIADVGSNNNYRDQTIEDDDWDYQAPEPQNDEVIILRDFTDNHQYRIEWYSTFDNSLQLIDAQTASGSGVLIIPIPEMGNGQPHDYSFKIIDDLSVARLGNDSASVRTMAQQYVISQNETSELSDTQNLNVLQNYTFNVFPNPSNSYIYIELPSEGTSNLRMRNMLGEVVFEGLGATQQKVKIDVQNFAPGIYTVEYSSDMNRGVRNIVVW